MFRHSPLAAAAVRRRRPPAPPTRPARRPTPAPTPVLAAMTAELARSGERLRLERYDAPYFIAYQVKDVARHEIAGRYGAIYEDAARRDRNLFVDVRVGSYDLDSSAADDQTIVLGGDGPSWVAPRDAPLEGDAAALRNALWLATDERYKEALASFFKKKSREVYRPDDRDRAPSLSREAPSRHVDPPRPFPFDRERWRAAVRDATALFRAHPEVFDSSVKVVAERQIRWFASSEGSALVTEQTLYGLHVAAVTRAVDGQLLEDGRDFYARVEGELPSPEAVRAAVGAVIAELAALRIAPAIDPYTGPAILEPEAAGVLFHEAVGHRLEGERHRGRQGGADVQGAGRAAGPAALPHRGGRPDARARRRRRAERLVRVRRGGRPRAPDGPREGRPARDLPALPQAGEALRALERPRPQPGRPARRWRGWRTSSSSPRGASPGPS